MIHYHGTPFGGKRDDAAKFFRGRHGFVSWLRDEDLPTIADVGQGFAIDNGAYTSWKQGGAGIDLAGYRKFLVEWCRHPRFNFAVIPDTIDGSEQDNRDLVKWWDKNCWHPVRIHGAPVWHLHESLNWLSVLVSRWPIICIGSSGEWSTPGTDAWKERMNEAMLIICDKDGRPRTRIHGLRMLSRDIVSLYPFWSADSTNVVQNANNLARFGTYKPSTRVQRAEQIAGTIEAVQSPATYRKHEHIQAELFALVSP